MFRRISTKWVLAVLASVILPFLGFAWYVDGALAHRLSWDVVRYYLISLSADLAERVDAEVARYREDMDLLAGQTLIAWSVGEDALQRGAFAEEVEGELDHFIAEQLAFDALLGIAADGTLVFSNRVRRDGGSIAPAVLERWHGWRYLDEDWFRRALEGEFVLVNHHRSPLDPDERRFDPHDPASFHIGFAAPIHGPDRSRAPVGVLYGVVNWSRFQDFIVEASRREYFQGLIGSDLYSSSYAWLWDVDADTILAHPDREILGTRVSQPPVELPQLAAAARASTWDMYPEYEFRGAWKNAAFKHCRGPERGGFGWVVGIGINNEDIYATVNELRQLLIKATSVVLGIVVLWTLFIARRATRPVLELESYTRRVAAGDLDARVEVRSTDELGQLASAFNRMTAELAENRERIVRAEKEAAWREMARQVAHEIKNPLTPISLSANLLRRARDEHSPEFDRIFDRTIDLIQRQVENMRRIAKDFHAFAGERHKEPRLFDLRASLEEVVTLNAAWAQELGVAVELEAQAVQVFADPEEVRRVLINLVSNALEAMPEGGRLSIHLAEEAGFVRIHIRDTGSGLTPEAREKLFEPYFTTRSHGTGLGLAICKRIIDEMGGEITIEPVRADEGGGTSARIRFPARPTG